MPRPPLVRGLESTHVTIFRVCDYRGHSCSVQNLWKTGEPREEKPAWEPGIPAVGQEPGWLPGSPTHRGRRGRQAHLSCNTAEISPGAGRRHQNSRKSFWRGAECCAHEVLPRAGLPHHPRVPPAGTEGAAPGVPAPGVELSLARPPEDVLRVAPTGTLNKAVKEMRLTSPLSSFPLSQGRELSGASLLCGELTTNMRVSSAPRYAP